MKTNMPPHTVPLFVVLAVSCFHLGINMYIPSLPNIVEDFGAHRDTIQMSVGAFLLGSAISSLFYGILSDRLGRRPVILFGLLFFLVATILTGFATDAYSLIALRALQGVGSGCISVNCLSMIQEQYSLKDASKIMGYIGIVREFIIAFSPILGGYLVVAYGWRSTFFILAAFITLVLIYGRQRLYETSRFKNSSRLKFKTIIGDYKEILKNPQFIRYIIIFPILLCGLWSYITVVPFYFIKTLNIPTDMFGYYIAPSAIAYSIGSMLAPKFISKKGLSNTINLGIGLCLLAGILHMAVHFIIPTNIFVIVGVQTFYVFGSALVFAPSITKATEPFSHKRATANSLGSMIRQTGAGLGGIAGGYFNDSNLLSVALFIITLSFLAMIIFKSMEIEADRI